MFVFVTMYLFFLLSILKKNHSQKCQAKLTKNIIFHFTVFLITEATLTVIFQLITILLLLRLVIAKDLTNAFIMPSQSSENIAKYKLMSIKNSLTILS